MTVKRISDLPERQFSGEDIGNCFYVPPGFEGVKSVVPLRSLFDWIKDKAETTGLTVELKGDTIMFISK